MPKPLITKYKTAKAVQRVEQMQEARAALNAARRELAKVDDRPHYENATFIGIRMDAVREAFNRVNEAVEAMNKLRDLK